MAVGVWGGFLDAIPVPADVTVWTFAGPQTTVTTTAQQRLVGSAMAPLSVSSGLANLRIDLCFQPTAGGALTNFAAGAYSIVEVDTTRTSYAVAGSRLPGAGTWRVGFCTRGATAVIDGNDFVNGWVQVINPAAAASPAAKSAVDPRN